LCQKIGFAIEYIQRLLKGNTLTIRFGFYSPEHNCKLEITDAKIKIGQEPNPNIAFG
jgi:hypothetical protein